MRHVTVTAADREDAADESRLLAAGVPCQPSMGKAWTSPVTWAKRRARVRAAMRRLARRKPTPAVYWVFESLADRYRDV